MTLKTTNTGALLSGAPARVKSSEGEMTITVGDKFKCVKACRAMGEKIEEGSEVVATADNISKIPTLLNLGRIEKIEVSDEPKKSKKKASAKKADD